jgi:hypothetical protein
MTWPSTAGVVTSSRARTYKTDPRPAPHRGGMSRRIPRRAPLLGALAAFALGACTSTTTQPPAGTSASTPAATPVPAPTPSPAERTAAESRYEEDTNRPGGDLRTFEMPQGSPEVCAAACEREPGCYAYSYTKAEHAHHGVAACALKHNVPMASKSECCVSGVIRPWP